LEKINNQFKTIWIFSYHSAYPPHGYIQPGYIKNGQAYTASAEIAKKATELAGYKYLHSYVGKHPITGELIRYCTEKGIISMDVELPTYDPPDIVPDGKLKSTLEANKAMLTAIINSEAAGEVTTDCTDDID
jgi:hypothetical protein